MNKLRLSGILCLAAAAALELLPWGAVCNFAAENGEYLRETYSYFDPLPFGYANFGPLITALLSSVLLTLWVCGAVFESEGGYFRLMSVLSAAAALTSLLPLTLGMRFYSPIGAAISLLLIASLILSLIMAKLNGRENSE